MNHFIIFRPLPDIYHIQDVSKVCFTLVLGERDTLLWDTGIGLYDVAECIKPFIRGKLHVVLSHGHYDHACGHHYFDEVSVHPDDLKICRRCVNKESRETILKNAEKHGFLNDTFDSERYQSESSRTIKPMTEFMIELGNLEIQFIPALGHTIGSMVAYIPKSKLLLTGDMWNPHTWLFFPESQPLSVYTQTMKGLRDLQIDHVLCSHDHVMRSMGRFRAYIDGLSEHTFAKAEPCTVAPYTHINTYCCYPEPKSKLIFNGDKRE